MKYFDELNPVVLFRASLAEEYEMEICKKYFPVITQRSHITKDDLIIPRYSALPYYKELEEDVKYLGGRLINSYQEHCFVADLRNWYYYLGEWTPRTWFALDQIPDEGLFVLKGQTNSKKHQWDEMMFADGKYEASKVYTKLSNDGYVGHQQIYIREYIPLKTYTYGIRGLPITEEYRFFIYNGEIISSGFYWSEHIEWIQENFPPAQWPHPSNVPNEFLEKVIDKICAYINFWVLDVARTEKGEWIVIELNDGQQSGLSENDPEILYDNLRRAIKE